jgi:hypothetical protein
MYMCKQRMNICLSEQNNDDAYLPCRCRSRYLSCSVCLFLYFIIRRLKNKKKAKKNDVCDKESIKETKDSDGEGDA